MRSRSLLLEQKVEKQPSRATPLAAAAAPVVAAPVLRIVAANVRLCCKPLWKEIGLTH
jgi:hypothetical protein